jgi:UDP-N-acetylmuramoyl-L-alanyl-D-glutamate--2,6-diaminopimelate ligase
MIANSTISEIIFGLNPLQLLGKATQNISALSFDSREAKEGFMFFAIKGTVVDGHTFISQVITNGCTCIVCEVLPQTMEEGVCYIQVANTQAFMGLCAANFYQHPSKELTLVAITGTNGKTTVATLLFNLFRSLGYSVGLLSTVQNQINEDIIPATHTTPDSIKMNALLRQMVEEGCSHCFMEASSHAIHQNRIKGLHLQALHLPISLMIT